MNLITKQAFTITFKQFPLHLQFMWVHSSLWLYYGYGPWKGNGVLGCNALTKVPPPPTWQTWSATKFRQRSYVVIPMASRSYKENPHKPY